MKYLLALALLLCAALPASAQGQIACNQWSLIHDVGATSSTQLIPIDSQGRRIGLCGYAMIASVMAGAIQFQYGTGVNCGAGTTPISPQWILPVGYSFVNRQGFITEITPAANALCFVSTGQTGTIDAIVYWTYF